MNVNSYPRLRGMLLGLVRKILFGNCIFVRRVKHADLENILALSRQLTPPQILFLATRQSSSIPIKKMKIKKITCNEFHLLPLHNIKNAA